MPKAPNRTTAEPPVAAVTTFTAEPDRGIDPALDPHAAPRPPEPAPAAEPAPAKAKKPTADKE